MKINRCPKCGREPDILIARNDDERESICGYIVECYDCELRTELCNTRDEAIAKWNEMTEEMK